MTFWDGLLFGFLLGVLIGGGSMAWCWYCDHIEMHNKVKTRGRVGL